MQVFFLKNNLYCLISVNRITRLVSSVISKFFVYLLVKFIKLAGTEQKKRQKRKSSVKFFWIPTGKKHGHQKKDKHYRSYDLVETSSRRQIMTGEDSPTEKKEEFNFGRSTPPPTTSNVIATTTTKNEYGDVKTAAEPPKEEKDKEKDDKNEIDILRPDANPGYNPDELSKRDRHEFEKQGDKSDKDSDRDKDKRAKKIDGSDRLDGQWIPPADKKSNQEEEEDDNCVVKCLYYTMQCCECSIS